MYKLYVNYIQTKYKLYLNHATLTDEKETLTLTRIIHFRKNVMHSILLYF